MFSCRVHNSISVTLVPKFPSANHINLYLDKKASQNSWATVYNMHIMKYTSIGVFCFYNWDSVTNTVIYDTCFDDPSTAITKVILAIKNVLNALLEAVDIIAAVAIIAIMIVTLMAVLTGLAVFV